MTRFVGATLLALVMALVPVSTEGFTEAEAQVNGAVHFVNGHPAPDVIDICLGTETLADDLANGESADVDLPSGNQAISVAVDPETCAGATTAIVGGIDVLGGEVTAILGPAPGEATQGINDTSSTPADATRLTLRNGTLLALDFGICLNGELVDGTTVTGAATQAQAEVPSGPYDNITVNVPALGGCQIDSGQAVTLAACTNLVLNMYVTGGDDIADASNQVLIVGCELPVSDEQIVAFCAVLPNLQGIQGDFEALFASVVVGDAATYPSAGEVEALVDQINAVVAAGDMSVLELVRPQWLIATDPLRQLVAGLTAASFEFQTIVDNNPDRAQEIIDGARGEGPPDPEFDAAVEVLTTVFLDNCVPAGPPEPAAAATPVPVGAVSFTG